MKIEIKRNSAKIFSNRHFVESLMVIFPGMDIGEANVHVNALSIDGETTFRWFQKIDFNCEEYYDLLDLGFSVYIDTSEHSPKANTKFDSGDQFVSDLKKLIVDAVNNDYINEAQSLLMILANLSLGE